MTFDKAIAWSAVNATRYSCLQGPCCHDALSARLIEGAGAQLMLAAAQAAEALDMAAEASVNHTLTVILLHCSHWDSVSNAELLAPAALGAAWHVSCAPPGASTWQSQHNSGQLCLMPRSVAGNLLITSHHQRTWQ
jgi:hypothetical protein